MTWLILLPPGIWRSIIPTKTMHLFLIATPTSLTLQGMSKLHLLVDIPF